MAIEKVKVISHDCKTKVTKEEEVEMDIVPYVEPVIPKTEVEKLTDTVNYLMDITVLNAY